jgi:hypothetical protein
VHELQGVDETSSSGTVTVVVLTGVVETSDSGTVMVEVEWVV